MRKKLIGLIIGMLVVSLLLPSITAKISHSCPVEPEGRYKNCYIEASGDIHNDWPAFIKLPNVVRFVWLKQSNLDVRFGLYSYILFGKNATVTIYDKEGGTQLWQHQGIHDPSITLLGFSGEYVFDGTPYNLTHATINGNARLLGIRLYDFPDL
jgi:hypothetical protein